MAKRDNLKVEERSVLGKKVKKLRREGILPANIYGKDFESTAVQLPQKSFIDVYKKVHETGLVDLALNGQTLPVLIQNVQFNPRTRDPLHADFHKVNLKEKVTASVPVVAMGEPLAVVDKKGVLLQTLSELEVEALPTDLPEKIEVNVEGLKEVDEQITVGELRTPSDTTILTDASQVVFKIGELVTKAAEEQAAAEVAAQEAAAAESGAEAPAVSAEGEEKPTEEPKPQESTTEEKKE